MDAYRTSDIELVTRFFEGEEECFNVLLTRHYDQAFRLAMYLTSDEDAAVDVLGDVFADLPLELLEGEDDSLVLIHRLVYKHSLDQLLLRIDSHVEKVMCVDDGDGVKELVEISVDDDRLVLNQDDSLLEAHHKLSYAKQYMKQLLH